jgi:hypothetical protein
MMRPPVELGEFLVRYDGAIQSLTLSLRKIVLQELAPCHEYIFQMRSKVVLLYSATQRVIADGICNIAVFRSHVTLTFSEGTDLRDPGHFLRGGGKTMRHIRVASSHDLTRPELRDFLRQARALAGLARRSAQPGCDVVTRVKKASLRGSRP